jgi:regulator of chromosome condensation
MAVLNKDGDGDNLVMWGFGDQGQLANGCEDVTTPEVVALKGRVVLGAEGGGQHTIMVLKPKE